ncbi:MAG: portal protein, partial [Rhizomicrobium sp.]
EELLAIVRAEMQRSVGFENDQVLRAERLRALDMYKGDMRSEIPSLPNRSRAVSTDVADAVETILPDLMEIFTAGGDVVAFVPTKPGDEAQARQETDYLTHVVFQDNPGFLNLYTAIKDGLLLKTAVFEFGWKTDHKDEDFTGKTLPELLMAHQSGEVSNVKADRLAPGDSAQTYSFTVTTDLSGAEYWPIPPDDFSVSPETVRIAEATYCAARLRPRVQDLLAEGYDRGAVMDLEPYVPVQDQQMQMARDTAGEHTLSQFVDDTNEMLRQVEVRQHFIRLADTDGDGFTIWRVVTDATASSIVPYEGRTATKFTRVPFAAGSPYLVPHRFYGLSLAEQLFEVQKVKTVLTRALLDSSYFALNQRFEVSDADRNDYTIGDLLRNEPGLPIRSRTGNAIKPLGSSGLGFDAYAALEYFSTVAESRTGVVRNAQGLNPDTLHDTATGALTLMQAAQRRVRMDRPGAGGNRAQGALPRPPCPDPRACRSAQGRQAQWRMGDGRSHDLG